MPEECEDPETAAPRTAILTIIARTISTKCRKKLRHEVSPGASVAKTVIFMILTPKSPKHGLGDPAGARIKPESRVCWNFSPDLGLCRERCPAEHLRPGQLACLLITAFP
jgi:hypothetical protein